jgi:hypothetical protein
MRANGPFQGQVAEEEATKGIFGDRVKWKLEGVMRKFLSGLAVRRRGDENFLIWIRRKVQWLRVWLVKKTGEARLCLICNVFMVGGV